MYVKAEAVAEHFGISTEAVWKLARQGKIPSYKLGRQRRFVIEEIEEATKEGDRYGKA